MRSEDGPGPADGSSAEGERRFTTGGVILDARQANPARGCTGKLLSPARCRRGIDHVIGIMAVSEQRVCRVLGRHRSKRRKMPRGADNRVALAEDIIALARQYGRYCYRRVTALLAIRAGMRTARGSECAAEPTKALPALVEQRIAYP